MPPAILEERSLLLGDYRDNLGFQKVAQGLVPTEGTGVAEVHSGLDLSLPP